MKRKQSAENISTIVRHPFDRYKKAVRKEADCFSFLSNFPVLLPFSSAGKNYIKSQ